MIHIMSHNVTISMIWCGSDAMLVKTFINLSKWCGSQVPCGKCNIYLDKINK